MFAKLLHSAGRNVGNSEDKSGYDSIAVSSSFGTIKAHGKTVFVTLLLFGLFAQIYLGNMIESAEHQAIVAALRINNYLISLPPDERPKLIPPPELWQSIEGNTIDRDKNALPFGKRK